MVYIASDHGGFELKNFLVEKLGKLGHEMQDLGPNSYDPEDDYPDFAKKVAENVSQDIEHNLGIVICRSGVGTSIVANKFKGVRVTLSWNPKHARSAREHNNANVLALPADYVSKDDGLAISLAFIQTSFSNESRHVRRLNKIP